MICLDDMLVVGYQGLQVVPYADFYLGGEASFMKYVLGTGVVIVLGLSQCQREYVPHLQFMVVHEAVQVGGRVSRVRVADEVIGVVRIV